MLPNSLLNHILARHSVWFYSYINAKKNNCNAFGTDYILVFLASYFNACNAITPLCTHISYILEFTILQAALFDVGLLVQIEALNEPF